MARYGAPDPCAVLQELLKAATGELLTSTLRSIEGVKDLVIEQDLIFPLDHIASAGILKKTGGVEKIYKLETTAPPAANKQCAYLVRSTIANMKMIANHITVHKQNKRECKYYIICIPRKVHVCEQTLESEGVYGYVKLLEFPLGLIPLDTDLFSLELPSFFNTFFIDGDCAWTSCIAQSILQLESLCGPISHIYAQGNCAEGVLKVMKLFPTDFSKPKEPSMPRISHLFLFDRDIDYASVLLTQLTYSGLLDEYFGIKSGRVTFDKSVTGKDQEMRLTVNSTDLVYKEIRDSHFGSVFVQLKEKAQHLQSKYNERHGMSIGDMKNFVANELKSLQQQHSSLAVYIGSCEVIKNSRTNFEMQLRTEHNLLEGLEVREGMNFIEECINRQHSAIGTLRLLCLLSLTQDGIPFQEYKSLTQQFLQSYGYHYIWTFHVLKKLGLCQEQGTGRVAGAAASAMAPTLASKVAAAMASIPRATRFNAVTKRLSLIPPNAGDSYDLKNPRDMGYVFSGAYIPVASRLVEQILLKDGIHGYEDALKLLPGSTTTYTNPHSKDPSQAKIVLVYFLGGVTFAEIAALRLLGKLKGYYILVAATSTVNGNSLLENVILKGR
uniref:Putative vacuolar sorting protein vps33/slp1 sec1 family n=1 Tax=Amblyomma aureolatum TaxID=187763 RepID=A0A1E1X9V4_9ACAR